MELSSYMFKGILYTKNNNYVKKGSVHWVLGSYIPRAETTYAFSSDNINGRATPHDFIAIDTMSDWGMDNKLAIYPVVDGTVCLNTLIKIRNQYIYTNDIIEVSYIETGVTKQYYVDYQGGEYVVVTMDKSDSAMLNKSLWGLVAMESIQGQYSLKVIGNTYEEDIKNGTIN